MSFFWMPDLLIMVKAEKSIFVARFIEATVIFIAVVFQIFEAVKFSWTKINLLIVDIDDIRWFKGLFRYPMTSAQELNWIINLTLFAWIIFGFFLLSFLVQFFQSLRIDKFWIIRGYFELSIVFRCILCPKPPWLFSRNFISFWNPWYLRLLFD